MPGWGTNSYAYRNRGLLYIKQHKPEEACADSHKALSLGFTENYGDEVEELVKKNCQNLVDPGRNCCQHKMHRTVFFIDILHHTV